MREIDLRGVDLHEPDALSVAQRDRVAVGNAALSDTASTVQFALGKSLKNAAAGDWFPVLPEPEQIA